MTRERGLPEPTLHVREVKQAPLVEPQDQRHQSIADHAFTVDHHDLAARPFDDSASGQQCCDHAESEHDVEHEQRMGRRSRQHHAHMRNAEDHE
jgi:hypothetical protein